ncbi:MAG: sulfotransferase family 2 domain-containing protein [Crocinitomicaceae bacterium]|nr:sulfotransferase family 2 domain-containing protein [Crocinitomicaceae bacterium]
MILSHKHKFIFIHIWKTGGTSVQKALSPYAESTDARGGLLERIIKTKKKPSSADFEQHITLPELQDQLDKKYFDPYYKFAFVRNPLSWEVSYYHFITQKPNDHPKRDEIIQLGSFDSYIKWAAENEMQMHSQKQFVYDSDGKCLADFIGKYEELELGIHEVLNHLQIPRLDLEHLNRSTHTDFMQYYTAETERLVREILKDDFTTFGY